MDSRLLNAFHDDPFDGNYVKYAGDTQFWSNDNETLGLQLAETLNGILPIAPTEVISNNLFNNSILKERDYSSESRNDCLNTNLKLYKNYEDTSPIGVFRKKRRSFQHETNEIVLVDPNDEYESDFLQSTDGINEDENGDEEEDDDDDDEDDDEDENIKHQANGRDELRSCSRSTFRSRTDSSSIGDYESHSSDYDDDEDDDDDDDDDSDATDCVIEPFSSKLSNNFNNNNNNNNKLVSDCILITDDNDLKKSIDDVDPFAMQLDVNNFDLAAFITQDDQVCFNHSTSLAAAKSVHHNHNKLNGTSFEVTNNNSNSDSDSDSIVDVETIENDDISLNSFDQGKENDIECLDNVKGDPSWSPSRHKIEKKESKPIERNLTRNFATSPIKRQNVIQKRNFGIGKGKNISMHSNPSSQASKSKAKMKTTKQISNNLKNTAAIEEKVHNSGFQTKTLAGLIENKSEKIIENQNIPPVKIKIENGSVPQLIEHQQLIAQDSRTNLIRNEPSPIKIEPKIEKDEDTIMVDSSAVAYQTSDNLPKKRKLNLEEYKKRKENSLFISSTNAKVNNIQTANIKQEPSLQTPKPQVVTTSPTKCQINDAPKSAAVTSIVKCLKENQSTKRFVDPITEAKNKVLRMKELKKAQQIKIIDSTVSSKVARVTKLLPLKDIVKDCYKVSEKDESNNLNNSEYEEIISVSRSCNTDITIPPSSYSSFEEINSSRSLLKSNVLPPSISNSLQKVHNNKNVQISSNSLIVSIQDVVAKKNLSIPLETNKVHEVPQPTSEHGENKTVMHLRKNRIRKRKVSQSIQTESSSEYPFQLLQNIRTSEDRSNSYKSQRTDACSKYSDCHDSYSSDDEPCNCQFDGTSTSKNLKCDHTHRHRNLDYEDYPKMNSQCNGYSSRRCSNSSSENRSRSKSFDRMYNSNSRASSQSSRSKSRRRGASGNVNKNVSAPAVEERRIVYVGRIEQETTKEMLRRKFISYGPIKQISIHYKGTGMKYGFVTYEKSEDAFRVIDSGQKDDTINMYDISFGGRREFCRASYADLDNAGMDIYQSHTVPGQVTQPKNEDSFETLLLKVKAKLKASKS